MNFFFYLTPVLHFSFPCFVIFFVFYGYLPTKETLVSEVSVGRNLTRRNFLAKFFSIPDNLKK